MFTDAERDAIQEIAVLYIRSANRAREGEDATAKYYERLAQEKIQALVESGKDREDVTDCVRLAIDVIRRDENSGRFAPKEDVERLGRRIERLEVGQDMDPRDAVAERIGVILVHGVGQQTRFEHLDSEIRKLVDALRNLPAYANGRITVEIASGGESPFRAGQDVWALGPHSTARVIAAAPGTAEKHFHFHEVWWGDVNETYSIAKQIRFWLWGLSVWNYPRKERSNQPGADVVYPPDPPGGRPAYVWIRMRLLAVAAIFTLLGFSVGVLLFIVKRVFATETPQWLQVITNYVSGVKLYNQRRRLGPGFLPDSDDFLDSVGEAPRYSIRRRMIRAIADVACSDYDRWHVLAHSLGSVVAFNGLMETAYSWPGYLDEMRWLKLKAQSPPMAGPMRSGLPPPPDDTIPARPSWCGGDIAYRTRIFFRFKGLLTYGSPLEKFATIWPARVPIAREPAFQPETVWVNVFDPLDPISGRLKSFNSLSERCCPHPKNVGYASSLILLLAHIRYMTAKPKGRNLPTATMRWLLAVSPAPGLPGNLMSGLQFPAQGRQAGSRDLLAWLYWIAGFVLLAIIGGLTMPLFLKLLTDALNGSLCEVHKLFGFFADSVCAAGKP